MDYTEWILFSVDIRGVHKSIRTAAPMCCRDAGLSPGNDLTYLGWRRKLLYSTTVRKGRRPSGALESVSSGAGSRES